LLINGEAQLDEVAAEIRQRFGWPSYADLLPDPCRSVVWAAGEEEHWSCREFQKALTDLVRAMS
jgi:hypothetical protein